jgi:hypothetical protein
MKIYFCDICNQSIPLKDLDDGLAVAVKGKIVCASCSAATAGASKAPVGPRRSATPAGMLAVVFVLAVCASLGAGWLLFEAESKEWSRRLETATGETNVKLGDAGTRLSNVAADARTLREELDELRRKQENDLTEIAARRVADSTEVESRIDTLKKYLHDSEQLRERIQELEVKIAASSDSSGGILRDLGMVKASVASLDATVKKLATQGIASAPVKPPEDGAPQAPVDPSANLPALTQDLQKIAKKLKDPDPGTRWEGVDELGRSRDARVVPYLVPHLKDSDDLVRRQTAEVLGDLGSKLAIGPLIDALMDDQLHVRDSVFAALRKVSGQNLKFEPTAKKEDRVKQQKIWRTWFEQNQDKLGLNG